MSAQSTDTLITASTSGLLRSRAGLMLLEGVVLGASAGRNVHESLSKQGVGFGPEVRLVEICREGYAESILKSNRELATLMPCAFAAYKGDDGNVYVSGMNTRLMGTMFGGNVADVLGEQVARDEATILSSVVKGS